MINIKNQAWLEQLKILCENDPNTLYILDYKLQALNGPQINIHLGSGTLDEKILAALETVKDIPVVSRLQDETSQPDLNQIKTILTNNLFIIACVDIFVQKINMMFPDYYYNSDFSAIWDDGRIRLVLLNPSRQTYYAFIIQGAILHENYSNINNQLISIKLFNFTTNKYLLFVYSLIIDLKTVMSQCFKQIVEKDF